DSKTPGVFSVVMDSPEDQTPVALQWEFSIPPAVAVKTTDITIGEAAKAAGKAITCAIAAGEPVIPGGKKYACIVAGGVKRIGNGPVATVQYNAQADVKGAPIRIAIEKILAVTANSKLISFPNTAAMIEIK